jgi:hypothetical protein
VIAPRQQRSYCTQASIRNASVKGPLAPNGDAARYADTKDQVLVLPK